jgi:hypothetical protein
MIDAQLRFSNAQAVTATAASTNCIDLGAAKQLGVGNPLYFVVAVVTAMTDAGSDSTIAVTVETDDSDSFGSATTAQTLGTFAATSAAGTRLVVPMAQFATAERYVRLKYTTANGDLTTGSFTAYLTDNVTQWTAYADGITITS